MALVCGNNSKSGKKGSVAGYILKAEPTGFADGLDVECEKKRKV